MRPVFLIGLPGSGKTTLGRALGKRLDRDFIDLDLYIENRFRRSVGDIFASEGEPSFRRKEAAMLREAGSMEDVIVACGGGTPCQEANMDFMLSQGPVIWLEASEEVIHRRLCRARSRRPHFSSLDDGEVLERLRSLESERREAYGRTPLRFCADELENARLIAGSVERFLRQFPDI